MDNIIRRSIQNTTHETNTTVSAIIEAIALKFEVSISAVWSWLFFFSPQETTIVNDYEISECAADKTK